MKIALSLNGGGGKGIVQVGMAKAVRDLGIEWDVLLGVSVGALNGALIHQDDWEALEDLWMNVRSKDVYTWRPWDLFRTLDSRASLYDSSPLAKLLEKYIDFHRIQQNPKDFWINATNYQDKDHAYVSIEAKQFAFGDDLRTFLKASASPPVFFEPVRYRGLDLVDGGVVSNFNQHKARALGCDVIIHLYPNNDPIDPTIDNVKESLDRTLSVPSYAFLQREMDSTLEINQLRSQLGLPEVQTIIIRPDKVLNIGLLDFDYTKTEYSRKDLVQLGYESAYSVLDVLRSQLRKVKS